MGVLGSRGRDYYALFINYYRAGAGGSDVDTEEVAPLWVRNLEDRSHGARSRVAGGVSRARC